MGGVENGDHLYFEGVETPGRVASRGVRAPRASVAAGDQGVDEFFDWLFERAGLAARHYRGTSLARRLSACLRAVGGRDAADARRRIEGEPALLRAAVGAVLLGVTEFARDEAVFETLQSTVVPRFRERRGRIRVWSAACSDGHELYSVAILLAEAGLLGNCELWGTDCRGEAIERAAAGVFPGEALGKVGTAARARHFRVEGRVARASGELCGAMRWKVADLLAGAEPGPWDVILWRNMAIYLTPDAAERVWRRVTAELGPGGYLVVGKADHPPVGPGLRRVATCVYQKVDD